MRKECFGAIAMACSVFFAGSASAQSLEKNWQGFYFGGHGAYLSSDTSYAAGSTAPSQSFDGALLGLQAGYNWQLGNVVLGAEADVSFGNVKDALRDGNFLGYSGKIDAMGTVRGRLGYSFGSVMPYLTVGYGWVRLEQGSTCPDAAPAGKCKDLGKFDVASTETHQGFVYGGGVEWAIARQWSLKAEVLFMDLGTENYTAKLPIVGNVTAPATLNVDYLAKVGVNYRF
jgi:outer membrane immunogenic protein